MAQTLCGLCAFREKHYRGILTDDFSAHDAVQFIGQHNFNEYANTTFGLWHVEYTHTHTHTNQRATGNVVASKKSHALTNFVLPHAATHMPCNFIAYLSLIKTCKFRIVPRDDLNCENIPKNTFNPYICALLRLHIELIHM